MAASLPVTLAADQPAIPVTLPGAVAITAADGSNAAPPSADIRNDRRSVTFAITVMVYRGLSNRTPGEIRSILASVK